MVKVQRTDNGAAIYLRINRHKSWLPTPYTGCTGGFGHRDNGHKHPDLKDQSAAAKSVRQSVSEGQAVDLYATCHLPGATRSELLLAEQVFMLMNGIFLPEFYKKNKDRWHCYGGSCGSCGSSGAIR